MTECLNQLTFEKVIKDCLKKAWEDFNDNYDHECDDTYVPYGDTSVRYCSEPSDESVERAFEEFKDGFDIYDFIEEYLMGSQNFKDMVEDIVEKEDF